MDGGFGGSPGAESSATFTSWVAIALAAAGIDPEVQKKPGGTDAYSYLLEHAGEMSFTTDFERELLVVDAAGTSPHDFAGIDLVEKILERAIPEPAVGGIAFAHEEGGKRAGMNDTIFAVIALSPIHEPDVEAAVQGASTWIEREQNANGSWPGTCPKTVAGCSPLGREPQGEADMTGAAIEALNAAGRHHTKAQADAFGFLHAMQTGEGGFVERPGESEANVGSTAWVTQGIWAAGVSPLDWTDGSANPLSYLESMQEPDGHVRWRRNQELDGVWMTAYAGPALFGEPLPVTEDSIDDPVPEPTSPGSGGEGEQAGEGVDSVAGGEGAPLFSVPQPGSAGHTPGGARVLASTASRNEAKTAGKAKSAHHPRSPGPPRRHRAPTLRREAAHGARLAPSLVAAAGEGPQGHAGRSAEGKGNEIARLTVPGASAAGEREEVTGVPISSNDRSALEPGAPGLHGAGLKPGSATLAIVIAAAALLLALGGAALER